MAPYTESDPLLPIGSRLSDNNRNRTLFDAEKNPHDGELRVQSKHTKTSKFISKVLGLCVILSIILASTPQDIYDKITENLFHPAPQSVEQRVNQILSDTPLIGNHERTLNPFTFASDYL